MKKIFFLPCLILFLALSSVFQAANFGSASAYSSSNFEINNPVITSGQQNSSSTTFKVGQSISQSVTGKASSTNFQLWSGFQYFFKANGNTLTATAGNSQVSLSWSVPQTFLGVNVGTYELGVGTASGSYSYENVSSVTNFTKTGLSNGTQYFFKIKSKTLAGTVLTYSNETSATPTGTTIPAPPGGSGSSYGSGKIIFSGYSYPGSQIFLLKDASQAGNSGVDPNGNFQISTDGLGAGSFRFGIYAKDAQGRRSPLLPFTVNLSGGETKNISNIVIPPTIDLNNIEIKKGESLNIFGFAQKQTRVTLTFFKGSPPRNFTAQSGPEGLYNFNINTSQLDFGSYSIFTNSFFNNFPGPNSFTLEFKVGEKTIKAPHQNICPDKGDFNTDCRADLVDFSILAFWYLKPSPPPEIDLNGDGIIDLVDFSILAYNWTG